jgi:uncharacterized cupredoxin-like copper-binding protein
MKSKRLLATASVALVALARSVALAHGDTTPRHGAAHDAMAFGHPGVAAKANRTIDVATSDDMRFTPSSFTVKRGDTIRFIVHNRGAVVHELVFGTDQVLREHAKEMRDMPGMEHRDPNMVRVKPGGQGEITWTFDHAGRFGVACLVPGHFEAGMKGSIAVR